MPRREDTTPTTFSFPEGFETQRELEAFCQERNKTRAEATKDILIAWSMARHGNFSALSGVLGVIVTPAGGNLSPAASVEPSTPGTVDPSPVAMKLPGGSGPQQRRKPNGNATAVDLDM